MTLDVDCEKYKNSFLYCKPYFGWGWHRLDEKTHVDFSQINKAGGFHILIQDFFYYMNDLRGLIGHVVENGHIFHGLNFVCWTMYKGTYNFTDNICFRYDIEMSSATPFMVKDWQLKNWPSLEGGKPHYQGSVYVAENEQYIDSSREKFFNR